MVSPRCGALSVSTCFNYFVTPSLSRQVIKCQVAAVLRRNHPQIASHRGMEPSHHLDLWPTFGVSWTGGMTWYDVAHSKCQPGTNRIPFALTQQKQCASILPEIEPSNATAASTPLLERENFLCNSEEEPTPAPYVSPSPTSPTASTLPLQQSHLEAATPRLDKSWIHKVSPGSSKSFGPLILIQYMI